MLNQILFGIIGLIMLAIAGVGTALVVKNPETAKEIIPEASTVVKDVLSDATTSITNLATSKRLSFGDDDENESEDEYEDEDEDEGVPKTGTTSGTTGTTSGTTGQTTETNPPTTGTAGGIAMAEVTKYNSATSCYTAIGGFVYDLTSWINQHPGGSAVIKMLCGVDGTAAFNDQHGGHGKPEKTLAANKIGALAQ